MSIDWHRLVHDKSLKDTGILIDAMQRYMQFDTYGGVIPATAIDTLYTPDELKLLAEQAISFYAAHHEVLSGFSQKKAEETIRAHLCGIIKLPIMSEDLWHDAFTKLHEKNRKIYDRLSTSARVEMLLDRHAEADIIATSVNKYQSENVPEYSANDLIGWTLDAKRFYAENCARLERHTKKEQRSIIAEFLTGKLDTDW